MLSLLSKLASKSPQIRKIPGNQEQQEYQSTNPMSIHPNNSHLFGLGKTKEKKTRFTSWMARCQVGSDSSVLLCTRTLKVRNAARSNWNKNNYKSAWLRWGAALVCGFLFRSLGSTNRKSETASPPCAQRLSFCEKIAREVENFMPFLPRP